MEFQERFYSIGPWQSSILFISYHFVCQLNAHKSAQVTALDSFGPGTGLQHILPPRHRNASYVLKPLGTASIIDGQSVSNIFSTLAGNPGMSNDPTYISMTRSHEWALHQSNISAPTQMVLLRCDHRPTGHQMPISISETVSAILGSPGTTLETVKYRSSNVRSERHPHQDDDLEPDELTRQITISNIVDIDVSLIVSTGLQDWPSHWRGYSYLWGRGCLWLVSVIDISSESYMDLQCKTNEINLIEAIQCQRLHCQEYVWVVAQSTTNQENVRLHFETFGHFQK